MNKLYGSLFLMVVLVAQRAFGQVGMPMGQTEDRLDTVYKLLTQEGSEILIKLGAPLESQQKLVQRMRLLVTWSALLPIQQLIMEINLVNPAQKESIKSQLESSKSELKVMQERISGAISEAQMSGDTSSLSILNALAEQIRLRQGYLQSVENRIGQESMSLPGGNI